LLYFFNLKLPIDAKSKTHGQNTGVIGPSLEAFCDISHRLGGITPFGVFSNAFPGLKMWVTFACATANFLTHFIISIAVLENVPPDAGLQKKATFPH
jgi:hypothetical protein